MIKKIYTFIIFLLLAFIGCSEKNNIMQSGNNDFDYNKVYFNFKIDNSEVKKLHGEFLNKEIDKETVLNKIDNLLKKYNEDIPQKINILTIKSRILYDSKKQKESKQILIDILQNFSNYPTEIIEAKIDLGGIYYSDDNNYDSAINIFNEVFILLIMILIVICIILYCKLSYRLMNLR